MMWRGFPGIPPEEHGVNRDTVKRALGFARPYRGLITLLISSMLLAAIIGVLPPRIYAIIIDDAIPNKDFGQLNLLFAFAVVLAIGTTGINLFARWLSSKIGEGLIFDLRVALFDHIQRMPITFFTRTQTGALLSRLNTDVVGAQQTVTTASEIVSDLFILTTTFVAMVSYNWQITLCALVVVPFFLVLDRRVGKQLAVISRERMKVDADMSTNMAERFNVGGALLVKLFGSRKRENADFGNRAGAVRDWGIRQAVAGRLYWGAIGFVATVGAALIYWLGGRAVINGSLELGGLVAMAAYVQRLYAPLTSLATARTDMLVSLVSFERVFEILDSPIEIFDAPNAKPIQNPQGKIEFENVSFRYGSQQSIASLEQLPSGELAQSNDPSRMILDNISFTIEPGQMFALVGPSGAGKTTLSTLVSRIHDVNAGSIKIDGQDLREVTIQSVIDTVGVVTQDAHLFHDTVRANLLYARPDATDEEMIAAAKAARIDHVLSALPDGYDTVVGERGYRLSGGEKQRVAIARVLLKQPAIIVLDEATAHLDSETESLVQDALNQALTNRTSLVIAHRLSTVRQANQILVLNEGSIVERGTHSQLLGAGGLYQELYETQFAPSEVTPTVDQ